MDQSEGPLRKVRTSVIECDLFTRAAYSRPMVTINTDGISAEERVTVKFQSAYREMLAQLAAPGFADVLCAHEAAHLFYFALAGITEYEPMPARIRYDSQIKDYTGDLASVQMLKTPTPATAQEDFQSWFCLIACAHAAGGVVSRKRRPFQDGGDSDDKERFIRDLPPISHPLITGVSRVWFGDEYISSS
jgi:hypothetical protein